ncbi:carboxylesterase family protein, partial [Acinetobacter baumannii]
LFGLLVFLHAFSSFAATDPTLARTTSGVAHGTSDGKVVSFLGLPYAAPPVGKLRWAPPAAPESWQGIRQANSFGNICPQPSMNLFASIRGN